MFELNGSSSDDRKSQYALYQIDNLLSPPFRTATLVESETIEGQIGEGCWAGELSIKAQSGSSSQWLSSTVPAIR